MANIDPRPRTEPLLRSWAGMIAEQPKGRNFDFTGTNRSKLFQERVDAFIADPTRDHLEDLWSPECLTAADGLILDVVLGSWSGSIEDLASLFRTLRTADSFSKEWEREFTWKEALWECYTRLDSTDQLVVSKSSSEALRWFGLRTPGSFSDRVAQLGEFVELYEEAIGHVTATTEHSVPLKVEVEELLHTVATVEREAVLAERAGPYRDFYRQLQGGIPPAADGGAGSTPDLVTWQGVTPVLQAYAETKNRTGYREGDGHSDQWGGNWESWKESFARYIDEVVRDEFDLTALEADDIGPLFDRLENPTENVEEAEWPDLPDWVVTHLMGGHAQRKLAWREAVELFEENSEEGAAVLSDFFDDDLRVAPRLSGFREFTLPLTSAERDHPKSEGDFQRMATSLLMLAFPNRHISIQYRRLDQFVSDFSRVDGIWNNFEPERYSRFVPSLRAVRDDLDAYLDDDASMLDVHNVVYIYWEEGEP